MRCSNLLDCAFNLSIAATQDFLGFGSGIMDNLAMLGTDVVQTLVIVTYQLVKTFLLGTHFLAFVLPIAAVTHDVHCGRPVLRAISMANELPG